MIRRNLKRFGVLLLVLPATVLMSVTSALAAGPSWMPGFPLRAGATVILMWTPVPGSTEYKLLKKMGEGDYKEVYKGPMNTFSDADAPTTKTIDYKVIAVAGGKDGEPSAVVSLKGVEPLKPPAFTGAMIGADAITLRWTNPTGSMFFNLYRSEKADGEYTLLGSIQQETYTDRKIEKAKTYYYKVTAVDKNNTESDKSAVQEAKLTEVVKAVDEKVNITKITSKGSVAGEELYEFDQPIGIGKTGSGEIFVMDRGSLQFLDKDGKYSGRRANFKFPPANSILLGKDGNFILTSFNEKKIKTVDESGKVLGEWMYPQEGTHDNGPNSLAIDGEGNYWIADSARFQLIKTDPSGKVLGTVGRISGSYSNKEITENDLPGLGRVYYNAIDGKIYGVISTDALIKVIDPKTLKVLKTFGGIGSKPSQFMGISGLAFKKNGNMLILDQASLVVKEFSKDYQYVASYADIVQPGAPAKLSANFASNLLLDEALNRIYITATLGNQVYIYDLPK